MSGVGTLSKLPPELRIQIYDYVLLEKNEEILVVPTIHRKLSEEAKRQRILRLNRLAAEGRAFKPVAVKNSLLYLSKQISEEACAVLYGGHKFKLRTAQALDWFLALIGENRQHIRHVRVMNELRLRDVPAVGRIADKLLNAKNLRSLTLCPKVQTDVYVYPDETALRFFDDDNSNQSDVEGILTKLALVSEKPLKSLHSAQKSEDKLAGVVEMFRLDLGQQDSVQEQLSAFWKSAAQLCISGS